MRALTPSFGGEERYFSLAQAELAEAWILARGVAVYEIWELANGKKLEKPFIRVRGQENQLFTWASQQGRPWSWHRVGEDGLPFFDMTGLRALRMLARYGVQQPETLDTEKRGPGE